MRDTIEYRSAAVEIRGAADAPRLYVRAIAAGEQAGDRLEVFDQLPTQPEGGVLVGRLHPANKAPVLRAQLEERDGALILDCALPNTAAARDLAIEVRNKTLPMASIEFPSPGRSRGRRRAPDLPFDRVGRGARPAGRLPQRKPPRSDAGAGAGCGGSAWPTLP